MNPNILIKVQDIFEDKGWKTESYQYRYLINCLGKLNEKEQNFILELTSKYTYITVEKYEELIKGMFKQAAEMELLRKKIYVVPLLKYSGKFEEEMKQVKSSNFVAYLTKATSFKFEEWSKGKNLCVYNFLTNREIKLINEKHSLVIFIDDYIGSGKTAEECIEVYRSRGLDLKNCIVMSICIENKAKQIFKDMGIAYLNSEVEYFNITEIDIGSTEEKKALLKSIGKKIKRTDEYIYGYAETGALISLVRTPNNTIPFYWSTKGGRKAPFPR